LFIDLTLRPSPRGGEVPLVARCEGDGEEALHEATRALAEMVGLRLME
jgi:hypothetical protein